MKKAIHHLRQAITAFERGDVQTARHHIGHGMAASHRPGAPIPDEPEGTISPASPEPPTRMAALRARLTSFRG